ncbi:MAG: hypothetical protein JO251_07630 [Verrucomicrobia bacterium]|nr:hypothetical protein [Verrucomicrobiota bacterium]
MSKVDHFDGRNIKAGYTRVSTKDQAVNAKPREIKAFLRGQLAPGRTQELQTELLAAGIPL